MQCCTGYRKRGADGVENGPHEITASTRRVGEPFIFKIRTADEVNHLGGLSIREGINSPSLLEAMRRPLRGEKKTKKNLSQMP